MPRKPKSQDGNPYEIIRGMWEGAYVSHFVRIFQKKFGFNCLTTQDLEEALVEEESVALADIFARLLRYITGNVDILIRNFESFLRIILIREKADVPRFLDNGTTWQELTPEEKLGTLKWLIDHVCQTKEEDIADYVDENYSADDLRGICAGQDAFNNIYWYLDDLRLYREFSHKRQSKKDWECVCLTLSDWQSFIKQFRKTSNLQEKELYSYLNFELFPIVELELLCKKKPKQSKAEINEFLINREREDLDVMLEKKNFLDCSNGVDNVEVNGTDIEKPNGESVQMQISSSDENDIADYLKSEEDSKRTNMNHCDDNLNINESICSIANSLENSAMDIKTETNMCAISCSNPCSTSCSNNQDSYTVVNNTSCGNGSNCNNSTTVVTTSTLSSSRDNVQDVSLQQPLSDIPSDSSSVTSNKENAPPTSVNTGNEIPPMSAISNMVGSTTTPATTASVQPLPSNMVNKTSFQMETQYMQQQSQIFVFSTALANKAAESYLSGQFPSMIAFHCAQPGTKSFLEKYPLKVQQFNRQNPAAWLNTLAQMKQSGRQIKNPNNQFPGPHTINNRFPGPSSGSMLNPCSGSCNMHMPGMCSVPRGSSPWSSNCSNTNMIPSLPNEICGQPWPNQQFNPGTSPSSVNHRFPGPSAQGMNVRSVGPSGSPLLGCMSNMNSNVTPFQNSGLNSMPLNQGSIGPTTLTGVKVPDENLTPQQRQHREEQLAMIRKMQQLLFPEQQQMDQCQSGIPHNIGSMMSGMQHNSQARFGPGDMCVHSGMDMCFSPHQQCIGEHEHHHPDMYMGSPMMGPGFPQQNFPGGSASAQLEWQKLQHQFYEERRKKQGCNNAPLTNSPVGSQPQQSAMQPVQPTQSQQSMSQPPTPQQQNLNSPSPSLGLSPGTRMQGPPPPYHQTNRRTMPSPHPASPTPSSLSLPSPRMASGLPSPADSSRQFPLPTPPGPRLPHPSPGSTTPVGSNSLHTTPLNSPKPISSSGPGSNNATLTRTPTTPSNTVPTPASTPTSSCAPALPSSEPSTPVGSCGSNLKQSQSCNSDIQDSNSVGSTTNMNSDFTSNTCPISTNSGELFCHNTQSCSQPSQKHDNCSGNLCQKEPSLMPVPSPQQIQYLNAFDGQELTIQKQPNTSIRELDIMSPASIPPSMVMSTGSHSQFQSPDAASFPNTPGSCPSVLENSQDSMTARFPVSAPASIESNITRFTAPSPQMPGFDSGSRHILPSLQTSDGSPARFPGLPNVDMIRMPGAGPINHNSLDEAVSRFTGPTSQGHMFGTGPTSNINNIPRFPGSASEAMQRFRGPSTQGNIDISHSRFMGLSPHIPCLDSMPQPSQFTNMGSDSVPPIPSQPFPNSGQPLSSRSSPCMGNSFLMDGNMSHSHLQNLQKMTPPFDSLSGNKIPPDVLSPMGQCSNSSVNGSNNMSMPPYGGSSPITPSSQVGSSQRLSHFDPIASMAAMSESTAPLVTAGGNAQAHQNIVASNINMPGMQGSVNSTANSQPNLTNFTNMSTMQGAIPSTIACSMPNQYSVHNQMASNMPCGPQNTYANSTMTMQQLAAPNTTTAYNVNTQGPNMTPHTMHHSCQGNGANTISCSVTTNHPIMHTAATTRTSNSNMSIPGPRHGAPSFSSQIMTQRPVTPTGAGSPTMIRGAPFNSANIQVKANAPNTIQYLPARQQNASSMPNRAPTLEFLQRYATPLTNLDNKVPTHNLQYFPSNGSSNQPMMHGGVGMNSGNVVTGMTNNQRPVNMMMGPLMRGPSPNPSHPSGQIFPVGGVLPGADSPMFGRPPCPSVNNSMMPMNAMSGGQGPAMFPNKQIPLPMGGMAPDATQPLPPSMGQSFNYKQSPFYGPTTADPNYAVQFHNFQQQLYATNTRGSQMNSQNSISGQGFFGPK
ncbi:protein BCL9 homolog isoform X1 [Parasteatoda tepidariorum]|nr:protein BCL9 homolog isoform X1 [Parasteatoda tepidariorum]